MASPSWNQNLLLRLAAVAILLAVSAAARPCKTFYISSYSFTVKPLYPNPNPNRPSPFQFRGGYLAFVTQINNPQPQHHHQHDGAFFLPTTAAVDVDDLRERRPLPLGLVSTSSSSSSYDMSSLRDRTKDILSVVVALLFGVGCGALTAATMYLFWSLFSGAPSSYRHLRLGLADDEVSGSDSADDGNDEHPKKMGYVKLPEPDSFAKPVPVKEAV